MLPFIIDEGELPFHNLDYLFVPGISKALADGKTEFEAYVVKDGALKPFTLRMGELTADEKDIILKGCLINYYRG
jgi:aconitate hydratase